MFRRLAIAAAAATCLVLTACGGGGHTRGMFTGYVMGKTEAEIVDKYGEPAAVDHSSPEKAVIVYKTKTFDPDNANRTDPETVVYLQKGKDGKLTAVDVLYRG